MSEPIKAATTTTLQTVLPASDSPVWPILRTVLMILALTLFLYVNASHFDGGEIKTILYTVLASGGVEFATAKRKG